MAEGNSRAEVSIGVETFSRQKGIHFPAKKESISARNRSVAEKGSWGGGFPGLHEGEYGGWGSGKRPVKVRVKGRGRANPGDTRQCQKQRKEKKIKGKYN